MSTTAISLEQYLHADFSPDVDYVDGEIEERNVGEWEHGDLQTAIVIYLRTRAKHWGIRAVVETRVQTSPTRFRVPDVVVVRKRPQGGIITEPPLLCIEILSPEDRSVRMRRKIADYLNMGVPYVWVIDPADLRAEIWTPEGMREVTDGVLIAGEIRVPMKELAEDEAAD